MTHYFPPWHNDINGNIILTRLMRWCVHSCAWWNLVYFPVHVPSKGPRYLLLPVLPALLIRCSETKTSRVLITRDGSYSSFTPPPGSNLEQGRGGMKQQREGNKGKSRQFGTVCFLLHHGRQLFMKQPWCHECQNQNTPHCLSTFWILHKMLIFPSLTFTD